jgi:hypothetical protein
MKRSLAVLGLAVAVATISGEAASVHAKVIETIDDACSGDVVVKVPWAEAEAHPLDDGDIILARSKALCDLVEPPTGSTTAYTGVCQHDKTKNSVVTKPIAYSKIRNADHRFRWFCDKTAERSRCKSGTTRVQFLIGPDRLFRTLCRND